MLEKSAVLILPFYSQLNRKSEYLKVKTFQELAVYNIIYIMYSIIFIFPLSCWLINPTESINNTAWNLLSCICSLSKHDVGEFGFFMSTGQLSLSQKSFQGQTKWQLQTQKPAPYSIVPLPECVFTRLGCAQIYSIYHAQMHVSKVKFGARRPLTLET